MSPPVIQTIGLTKHYGDVVAVEDLNLTVESGQIFGFLGPNGAGKTTTVKMLLGLVRPTSGSVQILGQKMPEKSRALLPQIGAIVEAPAFYPFLSGRDNLIALAKMARLDSSDVDRALVRVGLGEAARRSFQSYSMGMKQRLALAAALLRRPRLVLLDEPTSGLDPVGQREIRALIPTLAESGCTVFLSSHVLQEVQEICDHAAILRDGRLVRSAPVSELVDSGAYAIFEITTDNPAMGRQILSGAGWVVEVTEYDGRLIVTAAAGRAADLNRTLAEQGVYASQIHRREKSLEEVFFEVMEENVA